MREVKNNVVINKNAEGRCICFFTGLEFDEDDGIVLGPVLSQAPLSYLCHKDAGPARLKSVADFNEMERNCNTCRHLERMPFNKREFAVSGLMYGKCSFFNESHQYYKQDHFMFAPSDWMGMDCYEKRE